MARKYLAHLDGIRGVGILEVIYYHMGFTVCRHAWLCISLFFALSGLLITGITVDTFEKHGAVDMVRFWSRRVGRLLPALLMTITVIAIVSYVVGDLDGEDQNFLRGDLLYGVFYLENVHLIAKEEDYFAGWQKPSMVRHVWTLAIEEQYYAVWPVLFWLWTRLFIGWKDSATISINSSNMGDEMQQSVTNTHEEIERGLALLSKDYGHSKATIEALRRAAAVENGAEAKDTATDSAVLLTRAEKAGEVVQDGQGTNMENCALQDVEINDPVEEGKSAAPSRSGMGPESHLEAKGAQSDKQKLVEICQQDKQLQRVDPRFTKCLYALCVGECLIILLSYLSSFPTIQEMGMSAAYFSTWSRCGDFACGGLVYLLVHLNPELRRRYKHDDGLEPMTFKFRLLCEVGLFCGFLLITVPPMLQFPLDDMLHFYFYYFRIPFSFSCMLFMVPGAMQTSEPLPSWAIFSRLLNHPAMAKLGMLSYGAYLFHWPIILWFGEPMNHQAFEEKKAGTFEGEEYSTLQLLRDHGIAFFSIFLAALSFFIFELPLLTMASKVKKPWKVLAVGLFCSFIVAGIILLCTPDAKDLNGQGDWEEFEATLATGKTSKPSWANAPGANASQEELDSVLAIGWNPSVDLDDHVVIDENGTPIIDHRRTPIGFITPSTSGMSIASILDVNTIPQRYLNSEEFNGAGDAWPLNVSPNQIYQEMSHRALPNTVLFACRSIPLYQGDFHDHPCKEHWALNVTWIWVRSHLLCSGIPSAEVHGATNHIDESGHESFFHNNAAHCSGKAKPNIIFLDLPTETKWEEVGERDSGFMPRAGHTYSGRQDRDAFLLQGMILAAADDHPALFNRQSIAYMRENHEDGAVWINFLGQYVQPDGTFEMPQIKHSGKIKELILGESVAYKIGLIAKEMVQSSGPCEDAMATAGIELHPFPAQNIDDLGQGSMDTIAHFIPCKGECTQNPRDHACAETQLACDKLRPDEVRYRNNIRSAISGITPQMLVIVDGHFGEKGRVHPEPTMDAWHMALEAMLKQAQLSGVKNTIMFTSSPLILDSYGPDGRIAFIMHSFHTIVEKHKCRNSIGGMMFTLYKWHLLVCPQYDDLLQPKGHLSVLCQKQQHGFEFILGDDVHPKGPSGDWLVGNTWRAFMEMYARQELGYSEEDMQYAGFIQCMLSSFPPDNAPVLSDIIQSERICI